MSDTEVIQIYQPDATVGEMKLYRAPADVMAEARAAAVELQKIIVAKPKPVIFNGEQYLELEDWEMLGHFYGYSAKVESTKFVEFPAADHNDPPIRGFEASSLLLNERTGIVVGRAEAMCLDEEENWGSVPKYEWRDMIRDDKKVWDEATNKCKRERVVVAMEPKPLFQLRSMAQTRASAKAFRTKLSWVAVLAGYAPTPACELDNKTIPEGKIALPEKLERKAAPVNGKPPLTPSYPEPAKPEPPRAAPLRMPAPATPIDVITAGQARRFYAIWKDAGKTRSEVNQYLQREFGIDDDRLIPANRYKQACEWADTV